MKVFQETVSFSLSQTEYRGLTAPIKEAWNANKAFVRGPEDEKVLNGIIGELERQAALQGGGLFQVRLWVWGLPWLLFLKCAL